MREEVSKIKKERTRHRTARGSRSSVGAERGAVFYEDGFDGGSESGEVVWPMKKGSKPHFHPNSHPMNGARMVARIGHPTDIGVYERGFGGGGGDSHTTQTMKMMAAAHPIALHRRCERASSGVRRRKVIRPPGMVSVLCREERGLDDCL